jgi:DNA repair exonuclease SbcCD ATPase subunit
MGVVYRTKKDGVIEELKREIESLKKEVESLKKEIEEIYKMKRPIEFIEVPCPVCQKYHKVPNTEGEYTLCNEDYGTWYAHVDKKGKVKLHWC